MDDVREVAVVDRGHEERMLGLADGRLDKRVLIASIADL